jgi:AcrR family transcriptional regulator
MMRAALVKQWSSMPRPKGSRNNDYVESRRDLARRISATLAPESIARASLREFATSAGVSLPTLRNYFADAGEVIAEVLAMRHAPSAPFTVQVARANGDFATSLRELIAYLAVGLTQGQVLDGHQIGLSNGMGSRAVGVAYLESIVEPALQAVEARLKIYQDRGEMRPCDPRAAALAIVSPLTIAMLHQHRLGGRHVRPLDIAAFVEEHTEAMIRAYSTLVRVRRGVISSA